MVAGRPELSGGCGLLTGPSCNVSGITASTFSGCNNNGTNTAADDYFTANVTVNFAYAPGSGDLTLKRGTTVLATKAASELSCVTSWVFNNVQMASDGADVVLTAEFSGDCTFTSASLGTAPASCSCVQPSFTACPSNITVDAMATACAAPVTYTATSNSNSASAITYVFSNATTGSGSGTGSSTVFNIGTTNVALTTTNACGTSTCAFTVTVKDVTIPAMPCLANRVYATAAAVNIPLPATMTDDCGFQKLEVRRRLSTTTVYTPWQTVAGGSTPTGSNPFNSAANGGTYTPATTVGTWVMQYRGWDVNNNYKVCQFNVKVNANMPVTEADLEALPTPQSWEVLDGEEIPAELLLYSAEETAMKQMEVAISPNPTEGMVTVAVNNISTKEVALAVIDQTGKILQQNTLAVTGGIMQTELNLDRMPSGIYFLKIQAGNVVRMERVVKF